MLHKICAVDWDDTIICSTWLKQMERNFGLTAIDAIRPSLATLAEVICSLIDTILRLGYKLHIVTNSEPGWVEKCSERFMPTVFAKLIDSKVPIISARDLYSRKFGAEATDPDNPAGWKIETFGELVRPFDPIISSGQLTPVKALGQSIYELCGFIPADPAGLLDLRLPIPTVELLVLGDSILDVWAANSVSSCGWVRLKLVKLVEFPDVWTLLREIGHVISQLDELGAIEGDTSLNITRGLRGELRAQYRVQTEAVTETHIDCFFQFPDPEAPPSSGSSSPSSTLPSSNEGALSVVAV